MARRLAVQGFWRVLGGWGRKRIIKDPARKKKKETTKGFIGAVEERSVSKTFRSEKVTP